MYSGTLKSGEMKFRYSGDWGLSIALTNDSDTKIYTDLTTDNGLSSAYTDVTTGGPNIAITDAGDYTITLKLQLQTGTYQAKIDVAN